jgi:guanine nucleotide-binding protein subunit alpha
VIARTLPLLLATQPVRLASTETNKLLQKYMAHILVDHEISPHDPMPADYLAPVKALWVDSGVRAAIGMGNEYALHDNLT